MFNYGEKKINFENYPDLSESLVKTIQESPLLSTALYNIFNTTSKGERKNVHIVNQNKDFAKCKIKIEAGNDLSDY